MEKWEKSLISNTDFLILEKNLGPPRGGGGGHV